MTCYVHGTCWRQAFFVGGENTVGGTKQASAYLKDNYGRWLAMLGRGPRAVRSPLAKGPALDTSVVDEVIRPAMAAWSREHGGRPLQFVAGNAFTGEQVVVSVGQKNPRGAALDDQSIFRLASMTKIMAGTMAAIAFEEGVVNPTDSIAQYLPGAVQYMMGGGQVDFVCPSARTMHSYAGPRYVQISKRNQETHPHPCLGLAVLVRYVPELGLGRMAGVAVVNASRSISPPWQSIRFRLALRTYAPWGVRVVSQTKSRKIPTRKILPLFFASRWSTRRRA